MSLCVLPAMPARAQRWHSAARPPFYPDCWSSRAASRAHRRRQRWQARGEGGHGTTPEREGGGVGCQPLLPALQLHTRALGYRRPCAVACIAAGVADAMSVMRRMGEGPLAGGVIADR